MEQEMLVEGFRLPGIIWLGKLMGSTELLCGKYG